LTADERVGIKKRKSIRFDKHNAGVQEIGTNTVTRQVHCFQDNSLTGRTMRTKLLFLFATAIVYFMLSGTALLPIDAVAEEYAGMCSASAAVALDQNTFVVADDEDNILRIYDRNTKVPLQTVLLSTIFPGEILDGKKLEIDLEGAAMLGDKIFWIGSHSTSKDGEYRSARHRLFALQFKRDVSGKFIASRVGNIYSKLIEDLEKDDRFNRYRIYNAKTIAPKDIGGVSIEGLAATPDGTLLIGFRNPLSGGKKKALLVTLLNPLEVIEGVKARFGHPIDLDLDRNGIRSIEFHKQHEYLIVAGPDGANKKHKKSHLYLYSNSDKPRKIYIDLNNLNVEAAFFYPQDDAYVQLLSDDGSNCDQNDKRFRSRTDRIE
jgi:hypothetical protein